MKRIRANKTVVYMLLILGSVLLAQSCSTTKNCGCGSDLNKVYKQPKHYR
jgi:hypothetical protein